MHMGPEWLVQEVKDSGLRGRGGAGFPSGNPIASLTYCSFVMLFCLFVRSRFVCSSVCFVCMYVLFVCLFIRRSVYLSVCLYTAYYQFFD